MRLSWHPDFLSVLILNAWLWFRLKLCSLNLLLAIAVLFLEMLKGKYLFAMLILLWLWNVGCHVVREVAGLLLFLVLDVSSSVICNIVHVPVELFQAHWRLLSLRQDRIDCIRASWCNFYFCASVFLLHNAKVLLEVPLKWLMWSSVYFSIQLNSICFSLLISIPFGILCNFISNWSHILSFHFILLAFFFISLLFLFAIMLLFCKPNRTGKHKVN